MNVLRVCSDSEEWDDFVLENDGHPLQLWGWGQVKASHGWKAERIFVENEDGEIIGGAQVLIRPLPSFLKAFAYIPRGPIGEQSNWQDVLDKISERVKREHRAVTLSVEPDYDQELQLDSWVKATNKILSAETILLDATKSESDLLANMAKKTRQYIRKSSADVQIKRAKTEEDLNACLEIYKQTAERAGFNLHANQYYKDIALQMRDYSPIFIAYSNNEPVAFLWLAVSATTSYELYGGVTERGQSLRANYALKWHAIRKVKEWGLSRYDFGGMVAGGVANFKQGWSEDTTIFAGTYDKPLSPLYPLWSKALPFAKRVVQSVKRKK